MALRPCGLSLPIINICSPHSSGLQCPFAPSVPSESEGFEGDPLTAKLLKDGTVTDW